MAMTPAQKQLCDLADALRADEAAITVLTRDLEATRAERDAYLAHLEQSQAEVTSLRLKVYELESRLSGPFPVLPEVLPDRSGTPPWMLPEIICKTQDEINARLSSPAAVPAHEAELASAPDGTPRAPSPAAAGSLSD